MRLWFALALAVLAGAATADEARINRLSTAFESWLDQNGAGGVLAVQAPDGTEATRAIGRDANTPVEIASLSKAITAVCAMELVHEGKLTAESRFDEVYGSGPAITLAQLITHSGGIVEDATQIGMGEWYGDPTPRWADVLELNRARGTPKGEVGAYHYSNENYALLGLMIEAASDQPYEAACRARALDPAGAEAAPSPDFGAFLPWGGWEISAQDYVRFHAHWFQDGSALGRGPLEAPHLDLGDGAFYGLGSFLRPAQDGGSYHFWHFGALCFPGRKSSGSYVATWFGTWTVFAYYDRCLDWDAMRALDQALVAAVFAP
jgi:CubicO group peptidase (beta-lactamase class C family)